MSEPGSDELVTAVEAALRLGMTESTFRRFARNAGLAPSAGPRSPYSWTSVLAALKRSKMRPGEISEGSIQYRARGRS